ncbi:hypothetical protein Bca52824_063441 [Brassica carinata]|uniref:Uncharacterized protein n=1 Tax=Brassica carinata TaxID=52824 RepID=A0A8X7QEC4_BRACI|nr:hypothetical protein Bca52824_063441 [Brassica carinata]
MLVVLPSGYYPRMKREFFFSGDVSSSGGSILVLVGIAARVSDLSGRIRWFRSVMVSSMAVCGQLAQTFTSDTFSTVLILALLCFGECLSLVLSRVSLLGFSPLTPEKAPHRFGYFSLVLKEIRRRGGARDVIPALVSPFGLVHFPGPL